MPRKRPQSARVSSLLFDNISLLSLAKEKADAERREQLLKEKEEREKQMAEARLVAQRQMEREREAEENRKRREMERMGSTATGRSSPPVSRSDSKEDLDWKQVRRSRESLPLPNEGQDAKPGVYRPPRFRREESGATAESSQPSWRDRAPLDRTQSRVSRGGEESDTKSPTPGKYVPPARRREGGSSGGSTPSSSSWRRQ